MSKNYNIDEKIVDDLSVLEPEGTYSYADYLKWTFDERVELIKGKLFKMSPAPKRLHQKIDVKILYSIYDFLQGQKCEVYTAPFDVRFPKSDLDSNEQTYTVVQPDICVICDLSKLDDAGCKGAPDLVVEVLSPTTAEKDLTDKFQLYEEHLVKEYWVVFPDEKVVEIFGLNESGKYHSRGKFVGSDNLTSDVLKGFSLVVNEVFED